MSKITFGQQHIIFNVVEDSGDDLVLRRDDAESSVNVDIAFVNSLVGKRIKFSKNFENEPRLQFLPGETEKVISLKGISQENRDIYPIEITAKIKKVSAGHDIGDIPDVTIRLVNNNSNKYNKIEKMPSQQNKSSDNSVLAELRNINKRLTALENNSKVEQQNTDDIANTVADVDDQQVTMLSYMQAISQKLGIPIPSQMGGTQQQLPPVSSGGNYPYQGGSNYPYQGGGNYPYQGQGNGGMSNQQQQPAPMGNGGTITIDTTSDPTQNIRNLTTADSASIAEIVKNVLLSLGLQPQQAPNTATVTYDGITKVIPIPPKPNCPPVVTTVATTVDPELGFIWNPCPGTNTTTPTTQTTPTTPTTPTTQCGTIASPMYLSLLNGWQNTVDAQPFPNSYDRVAIYRDGSRIYFMGNVTGTTDQLDTSNKTKTIFIIPAGCAPKTQQSFAVSGRTSNGGIETVELIIYPQTDGSAIVYAQNEGIIPLTIAIVGSYLSY